MKKRVLSLALVVVLVLSMCVGCSGNSGSDTKDSSGGDKDSAYTIGYNYFGSGPYSLGMLAQNTEKVIKAYGNKAMSMDDEFSVEKIVQDVENMISSGCDGLVIWLPAESLYPTIAKMCADAQIPFVLNDKAPSDPEIVEVLKANEYFAGAVTPADSLYGELCAQYALEQGWKNCIITSSAAGDTTDAPRIEGFIKEFEANGGKVLEELHADNLDTSVGQVQDALTATGEVDFIYATNSDYAINACTALEGKGFETKIISSGLEEEALNTLCDEESPLVYLSGDCWVAGVFSAIVLQNAVAGTPLKDSEGNVPWVDSIRPFEINAAEYELYKACFLDELCFSDEELLAMSGDDFDYDKFIELVDRYSFKDRVKAKLADGVITEEQVAAAGIELE